MINKMNAIDCIAYELLSHYRKINVLKPSNALFSINGVTQSSEIEIWLTASNTDNIGGKHMTVVK